jgi:hypothetical protein
MRSPLIDLRARGRSLARPISLSLLLAVLAGLSACGSTVAHAPVATATATPIAWATATPGTVLFQSDWSRGLDAWHPSDGWTVRDGMLEIDGQDNRTLTIPYQPTVRDYAVIFSVQVLDEPQDGGYFSLVAAPTPTAPGFLAQVEGLHTNLQHTYGDHPHALVQLDPAVAQDPHSYRPIDYEPKNREFTYHIEVRDNGVRFATDKSSLSAALALKDVPLSHGPLTIACGLALLRIGPLQIVAL